MSGYIGTQPVPQATQTRETFTATASQTSFATGGYQAGYIDVFLNGVKLVDGTDFTATNGSDVVLTTGAASGDTLEVVAYTAFTVADQTFTGDIVMSDGLTVDNDGATVLTVDRATSDGTIIDVQKNGTSVGSIGASGTFYLASNTASGAGGIRFGNDVSTTLILPSTNAGANKDGDVNLGYSSSRFKDLYLSGGVYLGGVGSSNLLDDYEEGTWTPRLSDNGVNFASVSTAGSYYIKVGNLVTITARLFNINTSGLTGGNNILIDNLPFMPPSSGNYDVYAAVFADRISFSSSGDYLMAVLSGDGGIIRLFAPDSGVNDLILSVSDILTTGSDIAFTMQYQSA